MFLNSQNDIAGQSELTEEKNKKVARQEILTQRQPDSRADSLIFRRAPLIWHPTDLTIT